jgi:hypothetical protein
MMARAGAWGRGTHPAPTLCEHRFVTDALSKAYSYTSRSPCFPLRFSSDLHAAVARAMECEQSCCSCSALCGHKVREQAATTTLEMSSSWNANHKAPEHTLWHVKTGGGTNCWTSVCSPPACGLKKHAEKVASKAGVSRVKLTWPRSVRVKREVRVLSLVNDTTQWRALTAFLQAVSSGPTQPHTRCPAGTTGRCTEGACVMKELPL